MRVRELHEMPFDKVFETSHGRENCHATGREACFEGDDPEKPGSWWCEYIDQDGGLHYGR